MATYFATAAIFGIVMLAMAVGVIAQGRRLKGSCGGTGESCSCSPLAANACPIRRERDRAHVAERRARGSQSGSQENEPAPGGRA